MKTKQTCYMCDQISTSREHVPPKCFFLEENEKIGKKIQRYNLITVPSCSDHNNSTSADDQYLLFVITSHIGNNFLAQKLFSTRVVRAIQRRPAMLGFISNRFPVRVNGRESIAYIINQDRIERTIDKMVRALYFHHVHQKLTRNIITHIPSLLPIHPNRFIDIITKDQKIDKNIQFLLNNCPFARQKADQGIYEQAG